MTPLAHTIFLGSSLESACYWLYLCYFGIWMRKMLTGSFSPVVAWDPSLVLFLSGFLVDYVWRKLLAFGYVIDPAAGLIYAAQGDKDKALKEGIPIAVGSLLGGAVAYCIVDAVHPVPFASWRVGDKGLVFCFCVELLFSTAHQMRNAYWLAVERHLQQQSRNGKSRLVTRGATATASLITSALVTLSAPFTKGGAMLHASYTMMAALAHKDLLMFSTLAGANLLAALIAGMHASVEFVPCDDMAMASLSPTDKTPPALDLTGKDFEPGKSMAVVSRHGRRHSGGAVQHTYKKNV